MAHTVAPFRTRQAARRRSVGAAVALLAIVSGCHLDALLSDPRQATGDGPIPSPPAALEFVVQPGVTLVDEPIVPPPEVVVRDSAGNPVTGFTGTVTITLDTDDSRADLEGTTVLAAVDGVVVFADLAVDRAGRGYRLIAAIDGVPTTRSKRFDVRTRDDDDDDDLVASEIVVMSGSAQSGTVGQALAAPYVARVADAEGDAVPGVTVAWSVTAGGGSVTPASSATNSSGQANATHTLGTSTGAHAVRATVVGLTPVTFDATALAAGAEVLAFTVQPSNTAVGEAITPAVEVTARDAFGNLATTFSGSVTLTLGSGGSGGSLGGTAVRPASGGIAAFPGLSVSAAGSGHSLSAAAAGVTGAMSAPFEVLPTGEEEPEPSTVEIVSGNGQGGTVGAALSDPYVVRVTDASGHPVPGIAVAWAVTGGGGSVSPGSSTTDVSGQASATHTLGTLTGVHEVGATVGALAPITFSAAASAGAAVALEVTVQPTNTLAGEAITPPVEITARDAYGNPATSFSGIVTLTLGGGGGGSLGGTTALNASGGVVSFPGLSISDVGSGYLLSASAAGVTGATSATFEISAPEEEEPEPTAVTLVSGDGQSGTVGEALSDPYVVRVTDAGGEPVPGVTVVWEVTGGGGSVSPGSSLTNSIGQASATHTLGTTTGAQTASATVVGLTPVTFSATAIAGEPSQLLFTTQPSTAGMGQTIAPPVRVTVQDEHGNEVTGFSGSITLSIAPLTGNPLATLNGTRTRAVSGGIATFEDLSIDLAGELYRLRASGAGLSKDSALFSILLL